MRWIREHKLVTFLVLVIVLSVSFLIYAVATDGAGGAAGGTITGRLSAPFVQLAGKISDGVTGIFEYRSLKEENEKLKKENQELSQQLADMKLSASELEELQNLKEVLNYKGKGKADTLVSADVTSMDGIGWMNLFSINVGSEEGIKAGSVVVAAGGLVGRVRTVGRGWSKIVSIVDTSSRISFCVSGNTGILGLIESVEDGELLGYTMDSTASIEDGDILMTSGMGEYPQGIEIGKVTKVSYDSNAQLQRVVVRPSVDFRSLQKVSVLK